MVKKKLISLVGCCLLGITLVGCSNDPLSKLSKKELIALANQQTADLTDKDVRIEELETLLKGVQEENGPTSAISTIDDGTGRLTFNTINGKIMFNPPFEYPNSTQASNTSSVNITDTLSISPTSNWYMVLTGTSLELSHTNGINGVIKAGSILETYDRDKLQEEVMNKFFANFPPEKITYSKLFLEDQCWGIEAKLPTTVDENPAYLRCGMLGVGEQCFTYMFYYSGEQDPAKDETIVSLLKTVKMLGQQLRIE